MPSLEAFRDNHDPKICITSGYTDVGPQAQPGETGYGCGYSCAYCNQQVMDKDGEGQSIAGALYPAIDGGVSINPDLYFNQHHTKTFNTNQLISELGQYPYWNPKAPVIISNFSDPSLNWPKAIDIAKRLVNELGQQGPIQFITKGSIDDRSVQSFIDLKNQGGHPIVIVTYSGMPESIEPVPARVRIDTMNKLRSADIPIIMSMRPMVMGVNGELEKVEQVLKTVGHLPTIITVGGLYVYQGVTQAAFQKAGFNLDEPYKSWQYPIRKILPESYRDDVRKMAGSLGNVAPIFNHSSCATSAIMTTNYGHPTPDSSAHWAGEEVDSFRYCQTYCPANQVINCQEISICDPEKIKVAEAMLKNMGYPYSVEYSKKLVGTLLVVNGSLPVSELYPIVREAGLKVYNLPSIDGVLYRTYQAIRHDLQDESCQIIATLQTGQEWFILISHYPQNNQTLTELYIRSRNQARITPYAMTDLEDQKKREGIIDHIQRAGDQEEIPEKIAAFLRGE